MKISKVAIIIALLACIGLGLYYVYNINVFNQDTLKTVDIRSGDFSATSIFALDENESSKLFRSLSSLRSTTMTEIESSIDFEMTLLNEWNITRNYHVLFTDNEIFIKKDNSKTIFQVDDPMFFFSHNGFDAFYSGIQYPELSMHMNNESIDFEQTGITWSFRRLDGTWHTSELADRKANMEAGIISNPDTSIGLTSEKQPVDAFLKIVDQETSNVAFEGRVNVRQLPLPEYDGQFNYELSLTWDSNEQGYKGFSSINIPVVVDLPESFSLSKETIEQGEMIILSAMYVNNLDHISVDQNISPVFKWFVSDKEIRGYIPTNYNTSTGPHTITITNTETGAVYTYELDVISRQFKVQSLVIDTKVEAATRNDAAYEEFRRIFNPVRLTSSPTRYYDEPFVLPTKGRLTTEFGESRTVNGAATSYRHNGIDIGAPKGEEVLATNSGKIVLAYNLILTGNTIIIDHGEGIFSVYEHLDTMSILEGDIVEQGQVIGTVGSTGFSTGPHLHFMISYFDINLEPGYFIYGEPLTKENYIELMK